MRSRHERRTAQWDRQPVFLLRDCRTGAERAADPNDPGVVDWAAPRLERRDLSRIDLNGGDPSEDLAWPNRAGLNAFRNLHPDAQVRLRGELRRYESWASGVPVTGIAMSIYTILTAVAAVAVSLGAVSYAGLQLLREVDPEARVGVLNDLVSFITAIAVVMITIVIVVPIQVSRDHKYAVRVRALGGAAGAWLNATRDDAAEHTTSSSDVTTRRRVRVFGSTCLRLLIGMLCRLTHSPAAWSAEPRETIVGRTSRK